MSSPLNPCRNFKLKNIRDVTFIQGFCTSAYRCRVYLNCSSVAVTLSIQISCEWHRILWSESIMWLPLTVKTIIVENVETAVPLWSPIHFALTYTTKYLKYIFLCFHCRTAFMKRCHNGKQEVCRKFECLFLFFPGSMQWTFKNWSHAIAMLSISICSPLIMRWSTVWRGRDANCMNTLGVVCRTEAVVTFRIIHGYCFLRFPSDKIT